MNRIMEGKKEMCECGHIKEEHNSGKNTNETECYHWNKVVEDFCRCKEFRPRRFKAETHKQHSERAKIKCPRCGKSVPDVPEDATYDEQLCISCYEELEEQTEREA